MKHAFSRQTNALFLRHWLFRFLSLALICGPAIAYDNSILPKFDVSKEGRGYTKISIHPDGDRWLVSECTDLIDPPHHTCYLFLFNLKSKAYQRYDLPSGYLYTDGQFSPSGSLIVGVRNREQVNDSHEAKVHAFESGEIFIMKIDGSRFQLLPAPRGIIKTPTLSDDEKKVIYWRSETVRSPGSKTTLADFDAHEFDIRNKTDILFAGPFGFFQIHSLHYRGPDEILISAWGARKIDSDMGAYERKYGSSELYILRRGATELPAPTYANVELASRASRTNRNWTYFLGEIPRIGSSVLEADSSKVTRIWRIPRLGDTGITKISVSPDGGYLAFIYAITPVRAVRTQNSVGIFDIQEERWIPVALPPPHRAEPLPVKH